MKKSVGKSIVFCILLAMGAIALGALLLTWDGLTDDVPQADVALVLGSKVLPDGSPSLRLKARLERALELYRTGAVRSVLVSGGLGESGHDEAVVMKAFLVERGVPAQSVHLDQHGNDTWSSAFQTARFVEANGWKSVTVVSQFFHITRTKLALRRAGVTRVGGVHANFFEARDLYSLIREVIAYGYYFVRRVSYLPK